MEEKKNLQSNQDTAAEDQLDQFLSQLLTESDAEIINVQSPPADDAVPADEIVPADDAVPADEIIPADETALLDELSLTSEDATIPSETEMPIPEANALISEPVEIPDPATAEPTPVEDGQIAAFEDTWIDEIMDVPMVTEEIGADESAIAAAGLVHPEDQEFVDILEELRMEDTSGQSSETKAAMLSAVASDAEILPTEADSTPDSAQTKEPEEMAKTEPVQEIPDALPEEEEYRPLRKIRPKQKDAYGFFSLPHLAAAVIWLAIIVFIGVSLGNILWEYAADMLAFGRPDSTVTITISEEDDLDRVSEKLRSTGLIKYPSLFKIYANLSDAMEDINPGTYTLNTLYDYNALVDAMSGYAARVDVDVVIPEGYNCSQIFQLLQNKGVSTVDALTAAAANVNPETYWFLEGVDPNSENWLEGYLFPDTYTFYLNHNPDEVLAKLLKNFDKRFTDILRTKLATLNATLSDMMRQNGMSEEYIAEHQMTLREVVIVASMIEKEAANPTEGYTVASVIYNRLTNPDAYPYLQIDATLVYVTGHSVLTAEDLALDNPYNTYKYPGLVPGPITNPSQASLSAALEPDMTNYYYYALNPATGVHKFSETRAEHEAFLDSLKQNIEE